MSPKSLLEPILENGIKTTHFFEGRLLSGKDLQDQQAADRTRRRQLGRAVGAGVVEGLEVEVKSDGSDGSPPVLQVKKGLAISARGELLELPQKEDIRLTRSLQATPGAEALFRDCLQPSTASIPNGAGVYLLVMSSAAGFRERAPKSGLGDEGIVKGCGSRYVVEGVQFRLVELDPSVLDSIRADTRDNLLAGDLLSPANPAALSETDRLSKLRNVLAHLCFGTEVLNDVAADPFALEAGESAYRHYSAVDDLHRLELLNGCDVPLALFYWTLDGIAFLDLWSVRRRPYELSPSAQWPTLISPRRRAEAEAMFLQFQDQIEQMIQQADSPSAPAAIEAVQYFLYLPPAGIVPLTGIGEAQGFDYLRFFNNLALRNPVFIEGQSVVPLLKRSFDYLPIRIDGQELLWLYIVRENMQRLSIPKSKSHPYMIFANANMPYLGNARFNIHRWDNSNYAEI